MGRKMLGSVCIYLITFILSLLNYHLINRCSLKRFKKNGFCESVFKFIYAFGPITLLYGLRYRVGIDYENYLWYSRVYLRDSNTNIPVEIGYEWLNKIANAIFRNEYAVFMLSGIVIFGILFFVLKKYKGKIDVVLAFYIFLMAYFGASCNIVRQMMAALILLYGCQYIIDGNWKKYFLCILIACCFHITIIFCVLFWLVRFVKVRHFKIAMILTSFVILIFPQPIYLVANLLGYGHLLNKNTSSGISGLGFLLYLVPILIIIEFFKKSLLKKDCHYNYYVALMYVQIPLQVGAYIIGNIDRFTVYSSIIQVILVPEIVAAIEDSKRRKTLRLIVIVWYFFYFMVMTVWRGGHAIIPYQTWIFR